MHRSEENEGLRLSQGVALDPKHFRPETFRLETSGAYSTTRHGHAQMNATQQTTRRLAAGAGQEDN